MAKKRGLGRGLDSLFGDNEIAYENAQSGLMDEKEEKETVVVKESGTPLEVDIELIVPNPNQPRKNFDETALQELADSISVHGVVQPIVLNKQDDKYLIIAGERRWRASIKAGLKTIPAIIKEYNDQQIKEISLIENLQREDLNPIEVANAIKALMKEFKFTQEEVAKRIGKARPTIANTLRLLTLDKSVIELIEAGRLSAGHAKCLIGLNDKALEVKFALLSCDNQMSVRELEEAIKKLTEPKPEKVEKPVVIQSLELTDLIHNMQRVFATKVKAVGNDNKGRIYIDYYTRDDLDRILELVEFIINNRRED